MGIKKWINKRRAAKKEQQRLKLIDEMKMQRLEFIDEVKIKIAGYHRMLNNNKEEVERLQNEGYKRIPSELTNLKPLLLFNPEFDYISKAYFVRILQIFLEEEIDDNLIGMSNSVKGWVYGNYSYNILDHAVYYHLEVNRPSTSCKFRCGGKRCSELFSKKGYYNTDYVVEFSLNDTKDVKSIVLSEETNYSFTAGENGYTDAKKSIVNYSEELVKEMTRSRIKKDFLDAKYSHEASEWA